MRRRGYLWFMVGVLVGLASTVGGQRIRAVWARGPEPAPQPPGQTARTLQTAHEVVAQRQKIMSELVGVISAGGGTAATPEELGQAIGLLGELHAATPQVVTGVMRRLEFAERPKVPSFIRAPEAPWEHLPALDALANIGLPAVPALVEDIRTQPDKDRRDARVFFLNLIVGEHAKSWLTQGIQQAEDRTAKARFEEALKFRFYGSGAYDINTWLFQPQEKGPWYKAGQ